MNFIDGVILIEELKDFPIVAVIVFIAIMLIVAAVLIRGIHIMEEDEFFKSLFVIVPATLIGVLVLTESSKDFLNLKEPTGSYEVVVTNECDMKVFEDTYEIVSYSDGKYTIKMK